MQSEDGAAKHPEFHIKLHHDRCVGAGHCAACAPDLFAQNPRDGVVILLSPNPPSNRYPAVREAEAQCPSGTIEVVLNP